MLSLRSMLSATMMTGTALALAAPAAQADDRTLFVWSGTVDREAIIVMRGAYLDTRGDGFESSREARVRIADALPRTNGIVRVQRADGRGEVDVIEQPTAFNGYTARVRIRDRQSGSDRYRLIATWDGGRDVAGYGRGDDDRNGRRDDDRAGRGPWGYGRGNENGNGRGNGKDQRREDRRYDTGVDARDAGGLRFTANVDDVAEIQIRGRRVNVITRSGRRLADVQYDVRGAGLPNYARPLDLRRFAGRGNVVIAQYPREWNDWTAIVRIDDSRGGPDSYDFDLRW